MIYSNNKGSVNRRVVSAPVQNNRTIDPMPKVTRHLRFSRIQSYNELENISQDRGT